MNIQQTTLVYAFIVKCSVKSMQSGPPQKHSNSSSSFLVHCIQCSRQWLQLFVTDLHTNTFRNVPLDVLEKRTSCTSCYVFDLKMFLKKSSTQLNISCVDVGRVKQTNKYLIVQISKREKCVQKIVKWINQIKIPATYLKSSDMCSSLIMQLVLLVHKLWAQRPLYPALVR